MPLQYRASDGALLMRTVTCSDDPPGTRGRLLNACCCDATPAPEIEDCEECPEFPTWFHLRKMPAPGAVSSFGDGDHGGVTYEFTTPGGVEGCRCKFSNNLLVGEPFKGTYDTRVPEYAGVSLFELCGFNTGRVWQMRYVTLMPGTWEPATLNGTRYGCENACDWRGEYIMSSTTPAVEAEFWRFWVW
jgi:hypothetical protein